MQSGAAESEKGTAIPRKGELRKMTPRQKKEYYSFVIPSILAFALGGVYSIVDGFFIGHCLGDPGLASVTIGYPLAVLIQAVGTGLGLAGAIRYTIWGAQDRKE